MILSGDGGSAEKEQIDNYGTIMIIGRRNQSMIRLISLPNDKFGSE